MWFNSTLLRHESLISSYTNQKKVNQAQDACAWSKPSVGMSFQLQKFQNDDTQALKVN